MVAVIILSFLSVTQFSDFGDEPECDRLMCGLAGFMGSMVEQIAGGEKVGGAVATTFSVLRLLSSPKEELENPPLLTVRVIYRILY